MDRGAWQAIVHRVAKSRTLLKQLSTNACMKINHHWGTSVFVAGFILLELIFYTHTSLPLIFGSSKVEKSLSLVLHFQV